MRHRLAQLPGVTVQDRGRRLCGIVTFTVDGVPADDVQRQLAAASVNTSVSVVTSARYDLGARNLSSVVRASVHYYNTEEETDLLCATLGSLST
ncbi:aminotransferase class V-fold PLP-dependent enzyme [Nonomuraea helvata]|uniref:aminotransferase class V-fold PLP-dependent enzyme n=1 Tax=Nonomuraea helvata TaxID=37484 RepID=UPI0031EA14A0